jgi:hypothetical protein
VGKAGLDILEKRKSLVPAGIETLDHPVSSTVTILSVPATPSNNPSPHRQRIFITFQYKEWEFMRYTQTLKSDSKALQHKSVELLAP